MVSANRHLDLRRQRRRSGPIANSQSTSLQTTVRGPGKLSFYWKVSSESGRDFLSCLVVGVVDESISGEVEWPLKTLTIPAGLHTVTWRYSKDAVWSVGSDCGWVDKVVYKGPVGPRSTCCSWIEAAGAGPPPPRTAIIKRPGITWPFSVEISFPVGFPVGRGYCYGRAGRPLVVTLHGENNIGRRFGRG